MEWTNCGRAASLRSHRRTMIPSTGDQAAHEPLSTVHLPPRCHVTAHGGHSAAVPRGLSPFACLGFASSGLPDDPSPNVLSRRESGCNGLFSDGASGTPVWTGPRPQPDDLYQLLRKLADHSAI